jgi:hypothetical protein
VAITVKYQSIKGFVHSKHLSQVTLTQQPGSYRMIISFATAICRHASSFLCYSETRGNTSASLLRAANFSPSWEVFFRSLLTGATFSVQSADSSELSPNTLFAIPA